MNARKIAWRVAAGVAVGSAVAALYGTKKGAELRKKIAEFTSQNAGGVATAITGIVGSLYGASGSKEESGHTRNPENKNMHNPNPENKNMHNPQNEKREEWALPSASKTR
ncbi:YtxH domain-containing protein [Haliscomenobacter sp.]|uniref:YtxH domain-containing protein n=1 Tax=Haliscomenobacter sp. TaxID=2717303 RepID=UPI0035942584